jgi:hypothetical protein
MDSTKIVIDASLNCVRRSLGVADVRSDSATSFQRHSVWTAVTSDDDSSAHSLPVTDLIIPESGPGLRRHTRCHESGRSHCRTAIARNVQRPGPNGDSEENGLFAKCIKLNEGLSSIHTFVVSRSRGGALPLATSDHIHYIFFVMLGRKPGAAETWIDSSSRGIKNKRQRRNN